MAKAQKVYFGGNFWSHSDRSHAGKEIKIDKEFNWGDEHWIIPSVYVCAAGVVIDFCIRADMTKMADFIKRWEFIRDHEHKLSRAEREGLEALNPLQSDFGAELMLNSKKLRHKHGCGVGWICKKLLPEGVKESGEAKSILEHYGLDMNENWIIKRNSYLYATNKRPEIKSLELKLQQHPVTAETFCFTAPAVGESISFAHPLTKTEHKLTVLEYEQQKIESNRFEDDKLEYPRCFTSMAYMIEPDIPRDKLSIYDCGEGDSPIDKLTGKKRCGSDTGVIVNSSTGTRVACSSIRFEPAEQVQWCLSIKERLKDDIEQKLI